ncbi:MAG: hypothetical protein KW793_03635, partial [Candidatus Doudnabacteria bacterium]|nr:hypothetical protein [Candidatus Doudnabacteria bacterium]
MASINEAVGPNLRPNTNDDIFRITNVTGGEILKIDKQGDIYYKTGGTLKKVEMDKDLTTAFVIAIEALHGETPNSLIR